MKLLIAGLLLLFGSALAAPGAHGPGGEHLDAPPGTAAGAEVPRVEASSETFELVGRLQSGELSILVDRFDTNEPVLNAQVTVQFGGREAKAKFHADHGDYSLDDPALLEALGTPGEHALVFTIVAGAESDLLEGELVVAASAMHAGAHGHDHWPERALFGAGALALAALAFFAWKRRRPAASAVAMFVVCGAIVASEAHAGPGAHGPGGEHLDAPQGARASGLARLPDGSVNLPKAAQRRLEIRTVLAPQTEAAATVELPGRVVMDPNAGGRVQPVHGGRIEPAGGGLPTAGQKVAKGQVLAYVRHHAEPFAQANQVAQHTELRASRIVAEHRVQRLASLEGTVPGKEIEAARVELQGLLERERRIGASVGSREALAAPVSGVIAVANAVAGQVVEARDVLFEVIDPARLLVEATLAEVALAERIAGAQLQGLPGVELRVLGYGRSLRDGVLPVTFRAVPAKDAGLPPLAIGQPVTVVAALSERVRGIVLPARAIVRSPSNEPVVWIKAGAERFVPQPVQVRPLNAHEVVVTSGLAPDNRVVVQGAALVAQIR